MLTFIIINIILIINASWCTCASTTTSIPSTLSKTCDNKSRGSASVQLKQVDYSNSTKMTSLLPRSEKSAIKTIFNWNDFGLEKENLEVLYPPIVDVSSASPNYMPAETVVDALTDVANNNSNNNSYEVHQYTRTRGHPRLVKIVAKFHSLLMERQLDPMKEVLITAGSLNSLDLAARAYINPGDEIILFEPFYFNYRNFIKLNGGKMVTVPLKSKNCAQAENSSELSFDPEELESKLTNKTKMIWLNNPNNPTGKVFTHEELTFIGDLAKKHNLLVLSDEAAQWYVFEDPQHIRIATLPDMFERTLTLTSGGKTFSNSGWRIGWVIAPEKLLWGMASILSPGQASVATPMQVAFAIGFEEEFNLWGEPGSHFERIRAYAITARDLLVSILRSVGAQVITPTAGYSVVANFTQLIDQVNLKRFRDPRPGISLYKFLLAKKGIATYPMSLFYSEKNMWQAEYTLRFTYFKTVATLSQLANLLPKIFKPAKVSEEIPSQETTKPSSFPTEKPKRRAFFS